LLAVTQALSSTYASGEEIGDRRLQESGNWGASNVY